MSTVEAPAASPPVMRHRRFTVDEYHRMIAVGVLREDDRCELIHGQVIEQMPPNPPHSTSTRKIARKLILLFPEDAFVVGIQDPVTLSDSEPQPDVYVAVGPDDRYADRHPAAADLLLVVEVADTSVPIDTSTKLALYAAEKVPQYWVVNLPESRVEVYTRPRGGKSPKYQARTDYPRGTASPSWPAAGWSGRSRSPTFYPDR